MAKLKLKTTMVRLDPTDYRLLGKLADTLSRAESRRVTASELIRQAIREYVARQTAPAPEGQRYVVVQQTTPPEVRQYVVKQHTKKGRKP